jgi:hypothetical protein
VIVMIAMGAALWLMINELGFSGAFLSFVLILF